MLKEEEVEEGVVVPQEEATTQAQTEELVGVGVQEQQEEDRFVKEDFESNCSIISRYNPRTARGLSHRNFLKGRRRGEASANRRISRSRSRSTRTRTR